jgi:hypothetical protein
LSDCLFCAIREIVTGDDVAGRVRKRLREPPTGAAPKLLIEVPLDAPIRVTLVADSWADLVEWTRRTAPQAEVAQLMALATSYDALGRTVRNVPSGEE